jgi:hypothetical protein
MFCKFREQKLYVVTKTRAMPKHKIYKTRIEIPPKEEFIVKWFVVLFGPHRPMRNVKGQN